MQTLMKKTSFLIALSVMTAPLSPVYGAFDFGNAGGNPTDGGQGTPTTDPVVETPTDTSNTPDTSGNPTGGQGGNPTDGNSTGGNPTDGGQGTPTPSTGNSGIVGTVKGAASQAANWAGDHKVAAIGIGTAAVLGTGAVLAGGVKAVRAYNNKERRGLNKTELQQLKSLKRRNRADGGLSDTDSQKLFDLTIKRDTPTLFSRAGQVITSPLRLAGSATSKVTSKYRAWKNRPAASKRVSVSK